MIKQQINLYRMEYRPEGNAFRSAFMLKTIGALAVVLVSIYAFAHQGLSGIDAELGVVARQEAVALERLQKVGPLIQAVTGEQSWAEQLDEASRMLAERQAMLTLLQGTSLGDTGGFSQHLRALARQTVDGIWLTRIALSPYGNGTRLEGRAIKAELIPLYVQNLTAEPAFAKQRFQRFQIDNPVEEGDASLTFSMHSELLMASRERRP